jgi:hypothetical protein
MKITRALSIRQPFAEQIMQGEKKAEYRNMPTKIRERVYIYASKKLSEWSDYGDEKLPKGVIVGSVEVIGCQDEGGEFAWILANPKRLKKFLKPSKKPQPVWFKPF